MSDASKWGPRIATMIALIVIALFLHAAPAAGQSDLLVVVNLHEGVLDPRCPRRSGQFQIADSAGSEWTAQNAREFDSVAIERVVSETFLRSSESHEADLDLLVCVSLASDQNLAILELMRGISGFAYGGMIALFIAPALNRDWLHFLQFTIAHEIHHAATARPATNGLDVLIREGRAHHFAWTLFPELLAPSAQAVDQSDYGTVMDTITAHIADPPAEFTTTIMFGGEYFGGAVPRWAGYTVGFDIVRRFASSNRDLTLSELARIPPRVIWQAR